MKVNKWNLDDYTTYNIYRQLIPKYENLEKFIKRIDFINKKTLKIGLIREWRAFSYLKNNYKFGHKFEISSVLQDFQGVDIVSYDEKNNIKFTFQVTGFFEQNTKANYIIKVGQQILIYKNGS